MRSLSRSCHKILALAAFVGGGAVFTSCHSIWRDAIFQGTEQFVLSLIDPTIITDMLDQGGDEQ
jgi:hypothetical protein